MKNSKITNLLGLAMRAGKIECGTQKIYSGIKSKKYQLVLVATDASHNSKDKFIELSSITGTPLIEWGSADELARAIGKSITIAIGIKDNGFAKAILKNVKENNERG